MQNRVIARVVLISFASIPLCQTWWVSLVEYSRSKELVAPRLADAVSDRTTALLSSSAQPVGPSFGTEELQQTVNLNPANGGYAELRAYAQAVRDTELFLDYIGKVESLDVSRGSTVPANPFRPHDDHPLFGILEARRRLAEDKMSLFAAVESFRKAKPHDVARINKIVNAQDVGELPAPGLLQHPRFEKSFYVAQMAAAKGWDLRCNHVVDMNTELNRLFGDDIKPERFRTACREMRESTRKIKEFLVKYEKVAVTEDLRPLKKAVESQKTIADFLSEEAERGDVIDRIRKHAEFYKASISVPAAAEFAVGGARKICDNVLPSECPIDERVSVFFQKTGMEMAVEVGKQDVILVWKDRKMEFLSKSDFDEFNVPVEKLLRVIVRGQGTFKGKLSPTPRNRAHLVYNRSRKQVDWSPQSLQKFHAACLPVKEVLGPTWVRLSELNQLSKTHSEFFKCMAENGSPSLGMRMPR